MTELLLVKLKGWGFKSLWPAVVVPLSDIPHHIQVKAKGRQVVKFFNTKASDQFGIAPFKETQSFYLNVDPSVFSKKPMLFKAYTDALEYAETNHLCKSQMDVLPEMLFVQIFSYIDWHSRLKLESVSRKWRRILFDRSLRDIDRIDLYGIVRDHSKLPQMVRSLVVDKHKLIKEIICSGSISADVQMMLMNTITNAPGFLEKLICLDLVINRNDSFRSGSFNALLNLCIDLNVLKLRCDLPDEQDRWWSKLDVSKLMNLTELSGSSVLYRNLRASQLTKLDYCHLHLDRPIGLDGSNQFRDTIAAISPNIEVLILRSVWLARSIDSTNTITMPKLTKLVLEKDSLADIAIDLGCSTNLRHLVVEDATCHIINFDLPQLHLDYFGVGKFDDAIFDQFLVSATDYPRHLSLLGGLRVVEPFIPLIPQRLSRFLCCISPCYTYSLRNLAVVGGLCSTKILSDVDSAALVVLVDHSPHLKDIRMSFVSANVQYLIELIIAVVCLDRDVSVFVHVRHPFMGNHRFIPDLYEALTIGVDLSVVQCRCQIHVEYRKPPSSIMDSTRLHKRMERQFRIFPDAY